MRDWSMRDLEYEILEYDGKVYEGLKYRQNRRFIEYLQICEFCSNDTLHLLRDENELYQLI